MKEKKCSSDTLVLVLLKAKIQLYQPFDCHPVAVFLPSDPVNLAQSDCLEVFDAPTNTRNGISKISVRL